MSVVKGALSVQSIACREKLKALDLSPIAAYLMNAQNGYGWCPEQVFRAIRRYKTFLFVTYLHPEILLVPTEEVDRVWHCHILHTRKYRQDCQLLFGYFIDHEPDFEFWGEAAGQNLDRAFAQTQALLPLFQEYFETDASREFKSVISDQLPVTRCMARDLNPPDANQLSGYHCSLVTVHYRSACGRPQQGKVNWHQDLAYD